MYNIGLKITIGTTYKGVVIKLKADTIAQCLTKLATMFNVQATDITIDQVAYVQEILTNPVSNEE